MNFMKWGDNMNKKYDEATLRDFRESLSNINVTTVHAAENHIERTEEIVDYEDKARKYADERGVIFYELEGNIMTYEEQVKDSRTSYGLYKAEVDLDTGIVKQVKAK